MLVIFSSVLRVMCNPAPKRDAALLVGLVLVAGACNALVHDEVVSEARRYSEHGVTLLEQGALDEARQELERAEILATRDNDPIEQARALSGFGLYHETLQDYPRALESYAAAEQKYEAANRPEEAFLARLNRASCLGEMRRFAESLNLVQDAMAGASSMSNWHQAMGHQSLGLIHYATKDFDLAYAELAQARGLFEMARDSESEALTNLLTAQLLERARRYKDALNRFSIAKRQYARGADADATTACLLGLARCYRELGQPSIAQVWVQKALEFNPPPSTESRRQVLALAATLHGDLGQEDAAARVRSELAELEKSAAAERHIATRRHRAPPMAPPPRAMDGEAWKPTDK